MFTADQTTSLWLHLQVEHAFAEYTESRKKPLIPSHARGPRAFQWINTLYQPTHTTAQYSPVISSSSLRSNLHTHTQEKDFRLKQKWDSVSVPTKTVLPAIPPGCTRFRNFHPQSKVLLLLFRASSQMIIRCQMHEQRSIRDYNVSG